MSLGAAGNILPPTVPIKGILISSLGPPFPFSSQFYVGTQSASQRLGSSQGLEQPRFPGREPQIYQSTANRSCGEAALLFTAVCSQMLCGSVIAVDRMVSSPVPWPTLTILLCLWWSPIFTNPRVRQPVTDGPRLWSPHRRTYFAPLIWLSLSTCTRREQDLTV